MKSSCSSSPAPQGSSDGTAAAPPRRAADSAAPSREASRASGADRYPHLFSPVRIGPLTVPNRFVVPALTTNFAEADGTAGPRLRNYLAARAEGGFGLVITENLGVHATGRVMPRMAMADSDERIPDLAALADAVKTHGAVLFGQISHAGRQTKSAITGHPLVAPSAIACPLNREVPRALTIGEIEGLIDAYVAAAARLQTAGFDGVEIHGAHGYLVGAFLSRYSNTRTDAYGGSLENRLRFARSIVAGIAGRCGSDFPISVRLSAEEFVADGLDLAQSCEIARHLERAGAHAISVSVGVYESFNRLSMITGETEGRWLDLAAAMRKAVSVPVMGVGRIKRPEVAEAGLRRGQIDLAAFGRASIADPALPRKTREGREERIVWCLGCNICLGRSARPETICPVNPAVGDEANWHFEPAPEPSTILVVGASVASLTAAWVAASRGHRVVVDTGGEPVGGMQAWRAGVPGQEEYGETVTAVTRRAERAGVRIGPRPAEVDVVWLERRLDLASPQVVLARADAVPAARVLAVGGRMGTPGEALVVGSDIATTEAALLLASEGWQVRLVTTMRDVGHDAHPGYREVSRKRLAALGVRVSTRLDDWRAVLADAPADALVVAGEVEVPAADALSYAFPFDEASAEPDGWIDDAYEAGAMTTGIYRAAALAFAQ